MGLSISANYIKQRLASYRPKQQRYDGGLHAAVALLLHDTPQAVEFFLIERAHKKNDPWSGQLAFPGGAYESQDKSLLVTAQRETKEEVGIDLDEMTPIGQLDDMQGHHHHKNIPINISCYVFLLDEKTPTTHSDEVASSFWSPLGDIQNSSNRVNYYYEASSNSYPAIQLSRGRILWGLTYRFTQQFLAITKH